MFIHEERFDNGYVCIDREKILDQVGIHNAAQMGVEDCLFLESHQAKIDASAIAEVVRALAKQPVRA